MNKENYGTAPYFFVDVNKSVLPSDNQGNHYSSYKSDLNHGYITLDIEAMTALFTRGKNEQFKTINGRPVLVGSSIRGPIRSIVEQMGFSELAVLNKEEAFFFRSFNSHSNYTKFMKAERIRGGWLVRERDDFCLYEAEKFQSAGMETEQSVVFVMNDDLDRYDFEKGKPFRFHGLKHVNPNALEGIPLKYAVTFQSEEQNVSTGVFMNSGEMRGKQKEAVIGVKSNRLVASGDELLCVLRKIENDKNRSQQFSRTEIKNKPLPCFYVADEKGNVIALGFNYFFRYPYKHDVGQLVHQDTTEQHDFATTIFGNESVANNSKVFFEDCYYEGDVSKVLWKRHLPHILAEPKASYFAHYLDQENSETLKSWNNGASIAGFKNYYHRSEPELWIQKEFKIGKKITASSPSFKTYLSAFQRYQYVHFLVDFTVNDTEKERIEAYVEREQLYYKAPKRNKDETTTYFLELKTQAHYNFFKDQKGIRYLRFYVNPPLKAMQGGDEFEKFAYHEAEETLGSKPIRVMPKGSRFSGRIRFENLSDAELGLLLLVLDLPAGHAHKMGMGKPIGLGSVRLTVGLHLSQRKKRYSEVFSENGWMTGSEDIPSTTETIDQLKACFANWFKEKTGEDWLQQERIQKLYFMLRLTGTETEDWSKLTRYLEMDGRNWNEFRNPRPLISLFEKSRQEGN